VHEQTNRFYINLDILTRRTCLLQNAKAVNLLQAKFRLVLLLQKNPSLRFHRRQNVLKAAREKIKYVDDTIAFWNQHKKTKKSKELSEVDEHTFLK